MGISRRSRRFYTPLNFSELLNIYNQNPATRGYGGNDAASDIKSSSSSRARARACIFSGASGRLPVRVVINARRNRNRKTLGGEPLANLEPKLIYRGCAYLQANASKLSRAGWSACENDTTSARRLTPSLIGHVGTIRATGSTVRYDMPWVTTEGRTCDDIRDVLRLPREPSGDNKRTTRTGTYQWTTLYCAEIALARRRPA